MGPISKPCLGVLLAVAMAGFGAIAAVRPVAAQDVRVFVTSSSYSGNLGGLAGADAICQRVGSTAFPGSAGWVAWLSDSTTDARDRIGDPGSGGDYVRATDPTTVIADDLADLTDNSLGNAVDLDETGASASATVFTGTLGSGVVAVNQTCNDWTAGTFGPLVRLGHSDFANQSWTDSAPGSAICDQRGRIYCFEDPATPVPTWPPWATATLLTFIVVLGGRLLRRRSV